MPNLIATWRLPGISLLALLACGCATAPRVADSFGHDSQPTSHDATANGSVNVESGASPLSAAAPMALIETPRVEVNAVVAANLPLSLQPDLLDHIRKGFMIEDVDQNAIDRELNWYANHPDYLERVWGRAELYLFYISEQLEKRNMPQELALLPVIESAFEPYAYSRARASGLWQFIADTGKHYGLKQNWWYDGRRDVVESTRAALDYLQALHDEFNGDWLLAIAAYNCGEMNVERAIAANQRAGKPTDFWNLKLPTETRAYVPKLLGMRRLLADPALYGLEFSSIPNVRYFREAKTGGQIDLQVVADIAGITREELYELNPAFHRWATDPTGPYTVLLPADVASTAEDAMLQLTPEQRMRVEHYSVERSDTVASIAAHFKTSPTVLRELNGMGNDERLQVGTDLRVPSSNVALPEKAARAAALVDNRGEALRRTLRGGLHVVRRGDSLYSIARRTGVDVNTLARLNGLSAKSIIRPGQKLVIAGGSSRQSAPAAKIADQIADQIADKGGGKSTSTKVAANSDRRVTYTVRRGDTLYSISRALQVTVAELLSWNDLVSSNSIKPGQKLVAFVSART
ncbi:MAG: LysM peptidoglycan-binding domain-containing protein [Steroidobacteraceae bacterium]